MDWLSIILSVGMTTFLLFYSYKRGMPIYCYYKHDREGKLELIEGEMIDRLNQEYRKIGNRCIHIAIPRVSYFYNGKEKIIDGVCFYDDIEIGSKVMISVYNEGGKHEAWITKDLPRMKQELKKRVIIMIVTIALLLVCGIM